MTEFSFLLSDSYFDKLYDIKDDRGNKQQSGNDAAKELLEEYIDILTLRKELQRR